MCWSTITGRAGAIWVSRRSTVPFGVMTTDPTRSNSGNMFYALMANMLVGGDIATPQTIEPYLPDLRTYYASQGYMEESSGTLFERFINTGMGANPLIANYESLLIEFGVTNRQNLDQIEDQISIIYPQPTVWSSHPIIALNSKGSRLLEALKDERIQRIAWEQHGFRSGLLGVSNDADVLNISGIAASVDSVIPLPRFDAMLELTEYLADS